MIISSDLSLVRKQLTRFQSEHSHAIQEVKEEKGQLEVLQKKVENATKAQKIIQIVAETVQKQVHKKIAGVVTRCLETVFGEDDAYEFEIQFEQKRGKTEANLFFVRNGKEIDPTGGAGGGVVDVAAFALRLSCLLLSQPARRRLLVLDESFKMLSETFRPAVRELLMALARDMNVQIIMITHSMELVAGKVVVLE